MVRAVRSAAVTWRGSVSPGARLAAGAGDCGGESGLAVASREKMTVEPGGGAGDVCESGCEVDWATAGSSERAKANKKTNAGIPRLHATRFARDDGIFSHSGSTATHPSAMRKGAPPGCSGLG